MKANFGLAVILSAAVCGLRVNGAEPQASADSKDPSAQGAESFDYLVRDDFFRGMRGDQTAFDRALKLCEEALAKNPQDAPAMVWHGDCQIVLAGKAFQNGDFAQGQELWNRGLNEMNEAVALTPDSLQVLIPRGSTLLSVAKYMPDPKQAKALVKTGVADYEKVLQIQKPHFEQLSVHSRGELLFGLADGWLRLGNAEKSREYLQQIASELDGSEYDTRAHDWLDTKDSEALQNKSKALSCIGCHGQ